MKELGLVEVINHNQKVAKWVRSWSVMQLVPVEIDNVVDAIFPTLPMMNMKGRMSTILTTVSWMMKTSRRFEG